MLHRCLKNDLCVRVCVRACVCVCNTACIYLTISEYQESPETHNQLRVSFYQEGAVLASRLIRLEKHILFTLFQELCKNEE